MRKLCLVIIVCALLVAPSSAQPEQSSPPANLQSMRLVEALESVDDFSIFSTAVALTGLTENMNSGTSHTVFVPTNAAFATLLDDLGITPADFLANVAELSAILRYHVVQGTLSRNTLIALGDTAIPTLHGDSIRFSHSDDQITINANTLITQEDIRTQNGIIHVIDQVLMPSTTVATDNQASTSGDNDEDPPSPAVSGTLIETITLNPMFSILDTVIEAAGLQGEFANDSFTVFAPSNEAFTRTLATFNLTTDDLLENPEIIVNILRYHLIQGPISLQTLSALKGSQIPTIHGTNIAIEVSEGGVRLNNQANIVIGDIETNNGIIHVVDRVLLPANVDLLTAKTVNTASESPSFTPNTNTIADIISQSETFSILQTALEITDIFDGLSLQDSSFTVLAPTDIAITNALEEGGLQVEDLLFDQDALAEIMQYHIIPRSLLANQLRLRHGTDLVTLQGGTLDITQEGADLFLNDTVEIVAADIVASNGVVHVIDNLLIPPPLIIGPRARLRFGHFSADTAAIDFYVNGNQTNATEVISGTVTNWIDTPAGTVQMTITPTGTSINNAAVAPIELDVLANTQATIALIGSLGAGTLEIIVVDETIAQIMPSVTRLSIINAVEDLSEINVLSDQGALVRGLAYPNRFDGRDGIFETEVSPGSYNIFVTPFPRSNPEIATITAELEGGRAYLVAVIGSEANTSIVVAPSSD